jgi:hypothetical protein
MGRVALASKVVCLLFGIMMGQRVAFHGLAVKQPLISLEFSLDESDL